MNAPALTIDSVHSDVIARTEAPVVAVAVHIHLERPVRQGNTVSVRFRLVKETTLARTSVSGTLVIPSDNEEELDELEKALAGGKPPAGLVEYIVLRLQPLILHIEDAMGIPPIPVFPGQKERGRRPSLPTLYQ